MIINKARFYMFILKSVLLNLQPCNKYEICEYTYVCDMDYAHVVSIALAVLYAVLVCVNKGSVTV